MYYMDRVRKLIGYDNIKDSSLTGRGVYVAVLDSGVASHPDIKDRIVLFKDFTNNDTNVIYDDNGHGTHV